MRRAFLLLWPALVLVGCLNVNMKVEPVEVNLHGTLDVNVKMEKALDDIFGNLDKANPAMSPTGK